MNNIKNIKEIITRPKTYEEFINIDNQLHILLQEIKETKQELSLKKKLYLKNLINDNFCLLHDRSNSFMIYSPIVGESIPLIEIDFKTKEIIQHNYQLPDFISGFLKEKTKQSQLIIEKETKKINQLNAKMIQPPIWQIRLQIIKEVLLLKTTPIACCLSKKKINIAKDYIKTVIKTSENLIKQEKENIHNLETYFEDYITFLNKEQKLLINIFSNNIETNNFKIKLENCFYFEKELEIKRLYMKSGFNLFLKGTNK